MESPEEFLEFVDTVSFKYELNIEIIHNNIYQLGTEQSPLFRLLYDEATNRALISFYMDVSPTDSVWWFSQLTRLYRNLKLSVGFFVGPDEKTYLGQDAEVAYFHYIRLKFQNDVRAEELDPESPDLKPNTPQGHFDMESAVKEFNSMVFGAKKSEYN